jgi:RimJ/RimL family protein N-acetyltransferase
VAWGVHGQANFEGGFLNFKRALETAGRGQARLLESERGAVVGFASVTPDNRWRGTQILDCFAHAGHSAGLGALLEALPLPTGKVQAYADTDSEAKIEALSKAGFREEARLERQFAWGEGRRDVILFQRFV